MLARLLLLFLITPVVELALLIRVGDAIGFWPTVGLILVTGITGSVLARREGLAVWGELNAQLRGGALPGRQLLDGVIILCAGALLITPGVLTDVVGFLGLLPPTRALIRRYAMRRLERAVSRGTLGIRMSTFGFGAPPPPDADASWQGTPRERARHADDAAPLDPPGASARDDAPRLP